MTKVKIIIFHLFYFFWLISQCNNCSYRKVIKASMKKWCASIILHFNKHQMSVGRLFWAVYFSFLCVCGRVRESHRKAEYLLNPSAFPLWSPMILWKMEILYQLVGVLLCIVSRPALLSYVFLSSSSSFSSRHSDRDPGPAPLQHGQL